MLWEARTDYLGCLRLIAAPLFVDLYDAVSVKALAPGRTNPEFGICATSLWTFKESSNNGGPPDLRGRFLRRRPAITGMKRRFNSWPQLAKPKRKAAGLNRRA